MLTNLIKLSGKKLLLPLYHAVSDEDLKHTRNVYSVRNTKQFIEDIDFVLKYYKPIDINTLIDLASDNKSQKENSVLFTFDDGLKEVYEVIVPILKAKGIPAIFFINSGFVDNRDLFYRYKASLLIEEINSKNISRSVLDNIAAKLKIRIRDKNQIIKQILSIDYNSKKELDEIAQIIDLDFDVFLKQEQPYLTHDQITSLIDQGFTIGSHGIDHPEYYKILFSEQVRQTTESQQFVKKEFNTKYNLFAFPFTDYKVSKHFFEAIYSSTNPVVDLSFGCAGLKDENFRNHLQRVPMEIEGKSTQRILQTEYLAYLVKKLIGKNKIRRDRW